MTRGRRIGRALPVVVAVLGTVTPAGAGEETCFGRTPTIVSGGDRIEGTDGDDVIVARGEVLLILAGAGDDLVCGGREVGIVRGGDGNDKLSPGEDNDWRRAYGDSGNDLLVGAVDSGTRLHGGDGDDMVSGGRQNDAINGGRGADELAGGPDNDRLRGGPGRDRLDGGGDGDLLYPGRDDDSITGGAGNDFVYELTSRDSATRLGDEEVDAGPGRDTVFFTWFTAAPSTDPVAVDLAQGTASFAGSHALAGIEDVVLSYDGPAHVVGDAEDNWLWVSGSPSAVVDGGPGDDVIGGGNGEDELDGGDGSDTVWYRWMDGVTVDLEAGVAHTGFGGVAQLAGFENIFGSVCTGDGGDDVLLGDEGPNRIEGSCGDDRLSGRGGDDLLVDDEGMDVLDGGEGDDSLYGGDDDDSLDGGEGEDLLDGGRDTDVCVNGETVRSCEGP